MTTKKQKARATAAGKELAGEAEAEEEDLTREVGASRSPPGALRVGVLAPIAWRVPPRHYGPWEQFASLLTEGLVDRGVDVTLFATADSITNARLVGTAPTGYAEDPTLDAKVWEALHIATVFERADEFDLIHNSFDFLPLSFSRLVETPVVTTIHGFSSERIVRVYERYNDIGHYVAISDADRHARLDYAATIHHGIELDTFEQGDGAGGYLLYFGRIHPDKGTVEAIDVAERSGLPLIRRGDRPGPGLLRPSRPTPDRRQPRRLRRRRRPGAARWTAGRGGCAPSLDRLRGAVRVQRRRGDGLRNTRDRTRARLDGRDRPPRRERVPGRVARGGGGRRRGLALGRPARRTGLCRRPLRRRPNGRGLSPSLSHGRRASPFRPREGSTRS